MKKWRSIVALIGIIVFICGCSAKSSTKSENNVGISAENNAIEDGEAQNDLNIEAPSDNEEVEKFFLIDHATVSYGFVSSTGNDIPSDYFDFASPYESYYYYEDGSPLMHEVHYVEGGYYTEWWQEDERGNVTDYEGRSASDRIHYVYDEDNHVIQEWGHNDNSYPKSVTIYDDYDEHGNYRYSRWIANMGNYSLIKDGGTWYDLDSIDSMPDHYSTYYYNYEYDDAGRLLKVERANYDGSSKSTHLYEYDEKGNLIFEKDSTYTYIREYYSNGIIAKQTKFFSSSKEVVEDISYDMHGNPISFTNDNGTTTTYQNEYDEHGNLVRQFTFNSEGKCKTYDIWRYISEKEYLEHYDEFLPFE